jgi:hypothetical protein
MAASKRLRCASYGNLTQADGLPEPAGKQTQSAGQMPALASPSEQLMFVQ